MMNSSILRLVLSFGLVAMNAAYAVSQNTRFIYLQTENKEQFYVKMDNKVMNASESGYLIIPRLADNTYAFTIGFHEAGSPEITTTIRIRDVNLGLLLKNPGDRNWTLSNLQTGQPLAIKKEFPAGRDERTGPYVDEFTRILAEVVNEPSIAWAPPVPVNTEVVVQQVKKPEEKKPEEKKPEEKKPAQVTKADTVQVKKPAAPVVAATNPNCKKTASQNEYIRLRKQMAGEENEKNMIRAANKQFLNLCFTTEQVMNLAILFVNEEEKYKFFVAAYPHVSDSNNFPKVKDALTDNYYKTRLDAMINLK